MKAHGDADLRISPVGELDDDLSVLYSNENVVGLQGAVSRALMIAWLVRLMAMWRQMKSAILVAVAGVAL